MSSIAIKALCIPLAILVGAWGSLQPSPVQVCPATPQNLQPDNCAKPLTGCICVGSVSGSFMSFPGARAVGLMHP